MLKLQCTFDVQRLIANTFQRQKRLAYNVADALNKTAIAAQAAIRADMQKSFELRNTTKSNKKFLLNQIKVNFASAKQGKPYAEIYVDTKPRLLLALYETGATRNPFKGKNVARPVSSVAREGGIRAGAVKEEFAFKELRFKSLQVIPDKRPDTEQFKGRLRTFILKSTGQHPLGGVFQRTGPADEDIKMVYSFARAYKLKRLLKLGVISKKVFADKFNVELSIAYAREPIK